MSKAFEITVRIAHNVVKLVQNNREDQKIGVVHTGIKRVPLPANQVTTVYVRARVSPHTRGQDILFSSDPPPEGVIFNDVLVQIPDRKVPYVPIPVTNTTDHTQQSQQTAAKQMLWEEYEAFAYDSDDMDCIPSLKMHLTLHGTSPVQKTYMSVPKPLHKRSERVFARPA